jgi:hypothetical protein
MIRFFDAKGERPHPSELVGKIVGKEGKMVFQTYGGPHLVTGHKKDTLVTKFFKNDDESIKDALARPTAEWPADDKVLLSKVFYVCDTAEEARSIYEASLEAARTHRRAMEAVKAEIRGLFTAIGTFEATDTVENAEATDEDGFFDSSLPKAEG